MVAGDDRGTGPIRRVVVVVGVHRPICCSKHRGSHTPDDENDDYDDVAEVVLDVVEEEEEDNDTMAEASPDGTELGDSCMGYYC